MLLRLHHHHEDQRRQRGAPLLDRGRPLLSSCPQWAALLLQLVLQLVLQLRLQLLPLLLLLLLLLPTLNHVGSRSAVRDCSSRSGCSVRGGALANFISLTRISMRRSVERERSCVMARP